MNTIWRRAAEPSSWAGLAAIALGAGEALQSGGAAVAETGDPVWGGLAVLAGLVALIRGERGRG